MAIINLNKYAPLITRRDLGNEIYSLIKTGLDKDGEVEVSMTQIVSMNRRGDYDAGRTLAYEV